MLQDFLQGIKELVFPDNCFLCRSYLHSSHQKQLCDSCFSSLPLNTPPFCLKCSRHVHVFTEQGLCPACLSTTPISFDSAWSACLYEKSLPDLIYAFKYHGKTHLKKLFNHLLIHHIDTYRIPIQQFDLIIPIPLHPTRLRERGFNQAELLSTHLACYYQIPHKTDILIRTKLTPSQTKGQAKQRWTNVQDAFRINSFPDIADKHVLIVDDLLTTAATVNAASESLKNAGAAYVGALTVAITP